MELRPEEISRIIRSQIKHYEAKINQSETGTVILIGDGIAKVHGLEKCKANELLLFENEWSIRLAQENNKGLELSELAPRAQF